MDVCKQIVHISLVCISQKIKGALIWTSQILFSYEEEDIGRFSSLHWCTFNQILFFVLSTCEFIATEKWRQSVYSFLALILRRLIFHRMLKNSWNNFFCRVEVPFPSLIMNFCWGKTLQHPTVFGRWTCLYSTSVTAE